MRIRMVYKLLAAVVFLCTSAYPNTLGKCLFSYWEPPAVEGTGTTTIYLIDLSSGVTTSLCRLANFEATSAVVDPGWDKAVITGSEPQKSEKSFLLSFDSAAGVLECHVSDIIEGIHEDNRKWSHGRGENKTIVIARTRCGGEFVGSADIWFSLGDLHYEGVSLGDRVLNSIDYSVKNGAFVYFIRGEERLNRISLQIRYPDGEIVNSFELPSAVKAVDPLGTNINLLYVE